MPHPKIPEGVPREIDLFLSSSNSATKTKPKTAQNLTSHKYPRSSLDETDLTLRNGYVRAVGTGQREEEAVSRGKRCPARFPAGVPGFLGGGEGSPACSASGKSFGRGPRPRWPARREHCPTGADPSGRQARRAPDADRVPGAASGKRPVGNGGFLRLGKATFFVGLARLIARVCVLEFCELFLVKIKPSKIKLLINL